MTKDKTAHAIPPDMGMNCFTDLPLQSLDGLIERYERALATDLDRPLGAPRAMVKDWLAKATAEWDRRTAAAS